MKTINLGGQTLPKIIATIIKNSMKAHKLLFCYVEIEMPTIVKKYKPRAKELKGLKKEVREYNSIINKQKLEEDEIRKIISYRFTILSRLLKLHGTTNFNNAFDIARKECYEYLEGLYSKER